MLKPSWIEAILKFLVVLDRLLPMAVIAKNISLKRKINNLKAEVSIAKYHLRLQQIEKDIEASYDNKSDRDIIDDIIYDGSNSRPQ